MNQAMELIEDVRKQTEVDERALTEARKRRDAVTQVVRTYRGVQRTFRSGSVATGVVTNEVSDADGGCVLDRRFYPNLGPDGGDESPRDVVSELHELIGPELRVTWPEALVCDMKRGFRVFFHDPLPDGQDPYVDWVVALERKDAPGLWIPNLDLERWDAAHPEKHVALLTSGSRALRQTRARTIRLTKVWNAQWGEPGLCSFNLCALGLEAITEPGPLDDALLQFFTHAATSLERHLTPDPAGVSGPIRLKLPKDQVLKRVRSARDALEQAVNGADVAQELHDVFWKYLPDPPGAFSKDGVAALLRGGTPRLRSTPAGVALAGDLKHPRAYGGHPRG